MQEVGTRGETKRSRKTRDGVIPQRLLSLQQVAPAGTLDSALKSPESPRRALPQFHTVQLRVRLPRCCMRFVLRAERAAERPNAPLNLRAEENTSAADRRANSVPQAGRRADLPRQR